MEVTRSGLTFEGVPAIAAGTSGSATQSFGFDGQLLDLPDRVQSSVYATNLTVSLKQGPPDLSFIREFVVTTSTANEGSPETLITYQRPDDVPVGDTVSTPVKDSPHTLKELAAETTVYQMTITGTLPTEPWTIDLTMTYRGAFTFTP